jgi:hypothetical protein
MKWLCVMVKQFLGAMPRQTQNFLELNDCQLQ